jgi:NB-ARC domain
MCNLDPPIGDSPIKWLIIYDNVECPAVVEPFWPTLSNGAIILTSRNPDVPRHFGGTSATIEVSPFQNDIGRAFLLTLVDSDEASVSNKEDSAASDIVERVGNLPLAIAVIGSIIRSSKITLSQFLAIYQDFERTYLFSDELNSWDGKSYHEPISLTWASSITSIDGNPILARRDQLLMDMISFLDEDGVSLSLFTPKLAEEM